MDWADGGGRGGKWADLRALQGDIGRTQGWSGQRGAGGEVSSVPRCVVSTGPGPGSVQEALQVLQAFPPWGNPWAALGA